MSKELPYFKFHPSEWITGNITLCSMEAQGLFINLCAYYWIKDCSISLANAKQRFSNSDHLLQQLLSNEIVLLNDDETIRIDFLDEQMEKFSDIVAKRSKSGKRGGLAKAKQMLSKGKANANILREDKKKDKDIKYNPAFELWLQYKKERRETYKSDLSTQEAYKHLMTLAGGSPDAAMLIVKQSMANNWAGLFELKKQNKTSDAGPIVNAAAYKPLPKYQ